MERNVRLAAMAVLLVLGIVAPVLAAASSSAASGASATYDGQTIDLANGWDGAHVCVVAPGATTRCYASASEATAALAPAIAEPDTSCSNSLNLFQNKSYGGNELIVTGPDGQWIDLDDYGFGDETSSWQNTSDCDAAATKSSDGSGSDLSMPANSESGWVGSNWNDAINAVEIG